MFLDEEEYVEEDVSMDEEEEEVIEVKKPKIAKKQMTLEGMLKDSKERTVSKVVEVSEYERKRNERIKQNQDFMNSLGLVSARNELVLLSMRKGSHLWNLGKHNSPNESTGSKKTQIFRIGCKDNEIKGSNETNIKETQRRKCIVK
jgi:hypothetical protein